MAETAETAESVEMPETAELRVFTHPSCGGCPQAVKLAWEVAGTVRGVELRTVSLLAEEGLAEARRAGVTTIPTLLLSAAGQEVGRWAGTPGRDELAAALGRLASMHEAFAKSTPTKAASGE